MSPFLLLLLAVAAIVAAAIVFFNDGSSASSVKLIPSPFVGKSSLLLLSFGLPLPGLNRLRILEPRPIDGFLVDGWCAGWVSLLSRSEEKVERWNNFMVVAII